MTCGIYGIRNIGSQKMYVGSAVNIERRLGKHASMLARGIHPSLRLTGAYRRAGGWGAFETLVLEECAPEKLLEREQHWIDTLKPSYNARLVANNNLGLKWTDEQRVSVTASMRETSNTPEARERLRQTVAASWADPVQREARIEALKAAWVDPAKREAWSERMRGVDTKVADARAARWAKPGASERASEALRQSHAHRGPANDAAAVHAAVEATPGWSVVSMTGTRMKDTVTIHCNAHDRDETQTIRKAVHSQRGCRLCGFARSSEKQKGVSVAARGNRARS